MFAQDTFKSMVSMPSCGETHFSEATRHVALRSDLTYSLIIFARVSDFRKDVGAWLEKEP